MSQRSQGSSKVLSEWVWVTKPQKQFHWSLNFFHMGSYFFFENNSWAAKNGSGQWWSAHLMSAPLTMAVRKLRWCHARENEKHRQELVWKSKYNNMEPSQRLEWCYLTTVFSFSLCYSFSKTFLRNPSVSSPRISKLFSTTKKCIVFFELKFVTLSFI